MKFLKHKHSWLFDPKNSLVHVNLGGGYNLEVRVCSPLARRSDAYVLDAIPTTDWWRVSKWNYGATSCLQDSLVLMDAPAEVAAMLRAFVDEEMDT